MSLLLLVVQLHSYIRKFREAEEIIALVFGQKKVEKEEVYLKGRSLLKAFDRRGKSFFMFFTQIILQ